MEETLDPSSTQTTSRCHHEDSLKNNENETDVAIKPLKMSSHYMPLTGKEDALRLEDKYGMLESDGEGERPYRNRGKISQWKIQESPSKWLHSQSQPKGPKNMICHEGKCSPRKIQSKRILKSNSPAPMSCEKISNEDVLVKPDSSHMNDLDLKKKTGHESCIKMSHGEDNFFSEGFSTLDTERPKLPIKSMAAKVAFRLSEKGVKPPAMVPASINQFLRDYQREGIKFLYQNYAQAKGAILGDDMGLGKTVQVIGFLAALLGKQGNHKDTFQAMPRFIRELSDEVPESPPRMATKPFLIIGPSAVMFNWLDELTTWGYFTARKFHGEDKDSCLADVKKGKLEIVVTTFETFRDNAEKLQKIEWEAVIVDEVHKIKGMKAQVTKCLNLIKTPCRFGLTGTALQNNMTELFNILNWAQPGILGSAELFNDQFVQDIEAGQKHNATKRVLAQARKKKDKFAQIRQTVMLRRTKDLLADQLPSKEDLVVMCCLTDLQVSVYKAILAHPDMALILQAEDPCDCRKGKPRASCCYKYAEDGTKTWALILSYMHLFLKAANHCALLIPDGSTTSKTQSRRAREVCEHAFKSHPQFIEQTKTAAFMTLSDPKYCGKMKVLQGLLSLFSAAHDKVLIFSFSTRLLDIIEHYLMSKCYSYKRIDGKTNSQKRLDIVHQFNSDPDIFVCLISTKAGGLGLNLTGANRVIIFDPNWNPSHELQAQDRAFRIGQTRNVKVYRLISAGTIEENIYLRQIYKQQLDEIAVSNQNAKRLFHGIQGDKLNQGELFGIKNMFSLRTGSTCLTMDILQRNERLEKGLESYDITRYIPPIVDGSSSVPEKDEEESEPKSSSESEDDNNILESIFGKHATYQKTSDIQPKSCREDRARNSELPGSCIAPSSEMQNLDDDRYGGGESEDEEFSLIPTLYPKSTPGAKNAFTIEDITFSKSVLDATPQHNNVNEDGKSEVQPRNRCSALSLIFSDSDEVDDEDEETVERKIIRKEKELGGPVDIYRKDLSRKKTVLKIAPTAKAPKRGKEKCIAHDKGKKKKSTELEDEQSKSVRDVFEDCGVLHTHMNRQVVGSSRAEDHMTRCAIKDVFELHKHSQDPAIQCDPLPEQSPAKKPSKRKTPRQPGPDHNSVRSVKSGSTKILLGQTPPGVQRQQWAELCKFKGCDPLKLAESLVSFTPEDRLDLLRTFYSHRHSHLNDVLTNLLRVHITDSPNEVAMTHDKSEGSSKPKRPTKLNSTKLERTLNTKSRQSDNVVSKRKDWRKANKRRQLSPCPLVGTACLSLESQESLTAFSPPREPPSLEEQDSEGFSPIPPSKSNRRMAKLKSPVSKSTTRLRQQRAANEIARRKLFPKGRRRDLHYNDSDESESGQTVRAETPSLQTGMCAQSSRLEQEEDDVATLLTEMAGGKVHCRHENKLGKIKDKYSIRKIVPDLNPEVMFADSCSQMIEDTESRVTATLLKGSACPNDNKQYRKRPSKHEEKDVSPKKKQNYASLLDDIFSSANLSLENQEKAQELSKGAQNTVHISEKPTSVGDMHHKVASGTSPSKSTDEMLLWSRETSACHLLKGASSSNKAVVTHEKESDGEDGEALSIFDSLFKMSTLREETKEDKRTIRKRRINQNATFYEKDEKKEASTSTRKEEEWSASIPAIDESQSLFS